MSNINTGPIDENYPVPGVVNTTTQFKKNWASSRQNLDIANQEITELQNKSILKGPIPNVVLNNDMEGTLLSNALISTFRSTTLNLGNNINGDLTLDVSAGDVQYATLTGSINLYFKNWATGTNGQGQVQSNCQVIFSLAEGIENLNDIKIYLPNTVKYGLTTLEGYSGNGIGGYLTLSSFTNRAHYNFTTTDGGSSVEIQSIDELSLPANTGTGNVTSVGLNALGAGISVSGSPVTSFGNIVVTNTGVTSVAAGNNVSVSGATGSVTISSVANIGKISLGSPSAKGTTGDFEGKILVDTNYLYVCTADYDGYNNIWKRAELNLLPVPVADFASTTTGGTAPLSVTFTDASTNGPTGWEWDFTGNGNVDSTSQNPSYTYPNPGTYSITLTAKNANGSNSITKSDIVSISALPPPPPPPPPSPSPPPVCGPYSNVTVTGSLTGGSVWGSNPYTDDSDMAKAVVHAGLAAPGESITIERYNPTYYSKFSGSTVNGITTLDWNTGWCGFNIRKAGTTVVTPLSPTPAPGPSPSGPPVPPPGSPGILVINKNNVYSQVYLSQLSATRDNIRFVVEEQITLTNSGASPITISNPNIVFETQYIYAKWQTTSSTISPGSSVASKLEWYIKILPPSTILENIVMNAVDGSGNSSSVSISLNSLEDVFTGNSSDFNEVVTFTPNPAKQWDTIYLNVKGGVPNTSFNWFNSSGVIQETEWLDNKGEFRLQLSPTAATGSYTWPFIFSATGHRRSETLTINELTPGFIRVKENSDPYTNYTITVDSDTTIPLTLVNPGDENAFVTATSQETANIKVEWIPSASFVPARGEITSGVNVKIKQNANATIQLQMNSDSQGVGSTAFLNVKQIASVPPPPKYDEVISAPSAVMPDPVKWDVVVTGGVPGSDVDVAVTLHKWGTPKPPPVLTGTTLDANGSLTISNLSLPDFNWAYTFTFSFAGTGNVKTVYVGPRL